MSQARKIILVAGARPNFMKIAPIWDEVRKHLQYFQPLLIHTGQHYDDIMSKAFFEDLGIPKPDIHLGVGSRTHAIQTAEIMIEFEKVCLREMPDLVVVVGDINSTLAAALATVKLHIPIAHVEAGLRIFDLSMPEEVNRLLTDAISDYLFTPSQEASENLRKEGILEEKIFFVGNIMADTLLSHKDVASRRQILSQLGLEKGDYALLTLHRPDNVDDKPTFFSLIQVIGEISRHIPVVFPVHPRTQKRLTEFSLLDQLPIADNQLQLIQPLGYLDFDWGCCGNILCGYGAFEGIYQRRS